MGIAAATVTNCTHNGSLGFYANTIAEQHMIGIATTCSQNAAPPWGGVEPFLGTNPIAFGIPAKGEWPIIIDLATSSTTWRGLNPLLQSDKPIPWGWLLDETGEVTTDREKFAPRQGRGAMANMGNNHKGYALQLAVEMLGGVLPGLLTGHTVATERGLNSPSLIMAINVSFFQDVDAFEEKVAERIREIKNSKKKPGVDAIYLPGERGMHIMQERLRDGFDINEGYWNEIKEVAEQLSVPMPEVAAAA
jgi:LDH2 family malate/lactate/ureidoglycolate dehydrogenase